MRNIREDLFFAFIYNALGVPIVAGVLYPVFGWLLSPMMLADPSSWNQNFGHPRQIVDRNTGGIRRGSPEKFRTVGAIGPDA